MSQREASLAWFKERSEVDSNGCWLWSLSKNNSGYGQSGTGRKRITAHRRAYQELKGEIPEGLLVCHSCDVRHCVNPEHLFLGTAQANQRDMWNKGRRKPVPKEAKARGEKHGSCKLTEALVKEIRKETGTVSQIAQKYNVARGTVHAIQTRKTWSHVTI